MTQDKNMGVVESGTLQRGVLGMVIVMMCGSFLGALNQNLMNTALPTLMGVFNVSVSRVQWLITGYTLANGVMIPVTAYLVERFGTKKLYYWAMSLFGVGTVIAAAAPAFEFVLLGRIVQALGAGINMTLIQTVLFTVFPADKRGAAMGYFGLVLAFAPAIGPTLSGLIVDVLPWRALFAIQIPFVVILMVLAAFFVKDVTGGKKSQLDVFSVVLSTIGFGGVLYGFGSIGELGVTSPVVIGSIVVGVAGVVWFVVRQLHLETPVLNFRTFTYHGFTPALALSVGTWALFIGTSVLLPMYMQNMNGFNATQSGLAMMAGGLAMGILSPVTGRLLDSFGPRVLVPIGTALCTIALGIFSQVTTGMSMGYLAVVYLVFMVGQSMCSTNLNTVAINQLPLKLIAHGSAMNNTMRQVCSAIVTAVLMSILAILCPTGATPAEQIPGARTVFLIMAIASAVMFVASLIVLDNGRYEGEDGDEGQD